MVTGKLGVTNCCVTLQQYNHKIVVCWGITFHLEVTVGLLCTQREREQQLDRKKENITA